MSSLFEIITAHNTKLALDPTSGLVVSAKQVEAPLIRLVVAMPKQVSLAILTADHADDLPVGLPGFPSRCSLHAARFVEITGDHAAFISPTNLEYLTAPPLSGEEPYAAVLTADRLLSWETFRLALVPAGSVQKPARDRIEALERLVAAPLTADRVIECLKEKWPKAGQALDACLPLISTSELDKLAEWFRNDATLLATLSHTFSGNIWVSQALPELASWFASQATGPSLDGAPHIRQQSILSRLLRRRESQRPPPVVVSAHQLRQPKRVIGPEFDFLASHDGCQTFLSFPNACAVRARRSVRPTRPLAMVATARNEGVYLVEWLAYHRLLGIKDFFIYSNDNDDGSDSLLAAFADAGIITWVNNKVDGVASQFKAYGHALGFMPDLLSFRWTLVIDLDEFLVLDRSRHADAIAFSDWHAERAADTVAINWQFFAPEATGNLMFEPVIARNNRVLSAAQMGEGVRLIKSMSRPNRVMHSEAHVPFADPRSTLTTLSTNGDVHSWHHAPVGHPHSPKFADRVNTGGAVVNHYIYKSPEEWLWKRTRNPGDHSVVKADAAKLITEQSARELMSHLHERNLQIDDRAFEATPGLRKEMLELSKLSGVAAALIDVQTQYIARLRRIQESYRCAPETQAWSAEAREFLRLAGCC